MRRENFRRISDRQSSDGLSNRPRPALPRLHERDRRRLPALPAETIRRRDHTYARLPAFQTHFPIPEVLARALLETHPCRRLLRKNPRADSALQYVKCLNAGGESVLRRRDWRLVFF